MQSDYMKQRMAHILAGRPLKQKTPYQISKVSEKRQAKLKEEKKGLKGDDTEKEKWFQARRKELTGTCQCGCGRKSSKLENEHFRSSIAHIFPKAKFESVQYHPLNYVERNFWEGCHTNMDNKGMDKWPLFADWDDIKAKFHELAPLLTDEERATKFYRSLEALVYKIN